jgi:hypothetical protein
MLVRGQEILEAEALPQSDGCSSFTNLSHPLQIICTLVMGHCIPRFTQKWSEIEVVERLLRCLQRYNASQRNLRAGQCGAEKAEQPWLVPTTIQSVNHDRTLSGC